MEPLIPFPNQSHTANLSHLSRSHHSPLSYLGQKIWRWPFFFLSLMCHIQFIKNLFWFQLQNITLNLSISRYSQCCLHRLENQDLIQTPEVAPEQFFSLQPYLQSLTHLSFYGPHHNKANGPCPSGAYILVQVRQKKVRDE